VDTFPLTYKAISPILITRFEIRAPHATDTGNNRGCLYAGPIRQEDQDQGPPPGLGGPSLLAPLIPVLFRTTDWKKILNGISWDAWFMCCGALTLGALLKESGAALWLAQSFLEILGYVGMSQGFGLWVGLSGLSGLMTNFMSDAGTTALLGTIVIPMGIMPGVAG
jgi:hypothetical protein